MSEERWEVDEQKRRRRDLETRIAHTDRGSNWLDRVNAIGRPQRRPRKDDMQTIRAGSKGDFVKRLQRAINQRLKARSAPNHQVKVDGVWGPKSREALVYACYLLGYPISLANSLKKGAISPAEQNLILNPGKRSDAQVKVGKRRVAAHRKAVAKAKASAAKAVGKRHKIVAEAEQAAANYRKQPGAYHYLAGGVANLVFLRPSPKNFRSDCSQFAASVYKAAGLPSPAEPLPHQWASTFSIVKSPHRRTISRAHRKPGDLGMYGSLTAPHHVEVWCGDKFIGHGSPPIDSLTPGEPDYYVTFDFLD